MSALLLASLTPRACGRGTNQSVPHPSSLNRSVRCFQGPKGGRKLRLCSWLAARAGSSPSSCAPGRRAAAETAVRAPAPGSGRRSQEAWAPRAFERSPSRSGGQRGKQRPVQAASGKPRAPCPRRRERLPEPRGNGRGRREEAGGGGSRRGLDPIGMLLPRVLVGWGADGPYLPSSKPQDAG